MISVQKAKVADVFLGPLLRCVAQDVRDAEERRREDLGVDASHDHPTSIDTLHSRICHSPCQSIDLKRADHARNLLLVHYRVDPGMEVES